MGMIVHVHAARQNERVDGDCTNNGISAKVAAICVLNVDGPFKPSADYPPALMIRRATVGNVVIVPCDENGVVKKGWSMFGGNFGYTSDSRFAEKVRELSGYQFSFPVAIHDRYEG